MNFGKYEFLYVIIIKIKKHVEIKKIAPVC